LFAVLKYTNVATSCGKSEIWIIRGHSYWLVGTRIQKLLQML